MVAKSKDSSSKAQDSKAQAKDRALNFEQALSELEGLVSRMEAGDLSLEDSLKAFEEGVRLTRECQTRLAEAEQRVQLLTEEDGKLSSVEFKDESPE